MDGKKDVLGMYIGENESAKYWLQILNGIKNRGVEDILITYIDGLTGFPKRYPPYIPKRKYSSALFIRYMAMRSMCHIRISRL